VAALQDVAHTDMAKAHNDTWLAWLSDEFSRLGLEIIPSVANFISVRFGADGPRSAAAVHAFLKDRGILPREIAAYGMGDFLRFTIGQEAENRAVIAALEEFLEKTRA
jgi:histidinol-phosphate aminotransferase